MSWLSWRSGQGNSSTKALCVDMGETSWQLLRAPTDTGASLLRFPEVEGLYNSYSEFIYKS